MTKISPLFIKPVATTTDNNQHRNTVHSEDRVGLETPKAGEANSSGRIDSAFAVSWAKKYYSTVAAGEKQPLRSNSQTLELADCEGSRAKIVDKLTDTLKVASEIAWNRVEAILGGEIERQGIDPSLINASEITADTRNLYRKAIDAYGDRESVSRLAVVVGRDIIQVRRKYAQVDPLVLGFVTLEFQYTHKILLGCLSESERTQFAPYLKIVDDYLHTPYGEINIAAGNLAPNSKALLAVQHLLQHTTQIANTVYHRASSRHQGYRSNSGYLTDSEIAISGIRDIEIFQSYLCWCVLEGSIRPVQQELFPICVMLYPKLHVTWELVQDMLLILFWEISDRLPAEDVIVFSPYLQIVREMFSSDVFEN